MGGLGMIKYCHQLDVVEFNYLRQAVGWETIEANQAQAGLANSAFVVVARSEGVAVGMARVISDGGYVALIVDVIVVPKWQGQGIGREMMSQVMGYLNSSIKNDQMVMVNLMAASGKEDFYRQFGFESRPNQTMGAGMVQYLGQKY